MEGISNEACSLAGHWGLGKLIAFYDDNHISIDGDTEIAFTENVDTRFEALGWHVIWVKNGNTGYDEIRAAIKEAKAVKDKPTLIKVRYFSMKWFIESGFQGILCIILYFLAFFDQDRVLDADRVLFCPSRLPQPLALVPPIKPTRTVSMEVHWVPRKLRPPERTLDGRLSLSMCLTT